MLTQLLKDLPHGQLVSNDAEETVATPRRETDPIGPLDDASMDGQLMNVGVQESGPLHAYFVDKIQ